MKRSANPPLDLWLRRRRIVGKIWAALILLAAAIWAVGAHGPAHPFEEVLRHEAVCDSVGDDGALLVTAVGRRVHVTLLGLDPASLSDPTVVRQIASLVQEQPLWLGFDEQTRRDRHGRWAAYIYLPDGRMLNQWLIQQRLARTNPSTPHLLHAWFAKLERAVQRSPRGLRPQ